MQVWIGKRSLSSLVSAGVFCTVLLVPAVAAAAVALPPAPRERSVPGRVATAEPLAPDPDQEKAVRSLPPSPGRRRRAPRSSCRAWRCRARPPPRCRPAPGWAGCRSTSELALPPVTFEGIQLANRVDGADHIPVMNWWRLKAVRTESGNEISVNYSEKECAYGTALPVPATNGKRCHPVRWTPEGLSELTDWFNKYVVVEVTESDRATALEREVSTVEYVGRPRGGTTRRTGWYRRPAIPGASGGVTSGSGSARAGWTSRVR